MRARRGSVGDRHARNQSITLNNVHQEYKLPPIAVSNRDGSLIAESNNYSHVDKYS